MANFSNLQNDLRKVFKSMYSGYDFPYSKVNDLITKIGGAVAADSYAYFVKKFPNRAGMQEEWLASTFDQWRKDRIMRLMQAQQNQQLKIGRLINNARAEGAAYENVVRAYTGDMSRKHAVFEMRNASANLNAELDKNRMQEAGIDCYRWRTGSDEKVRATHREMQNKICRFDDPSVFYDEKTKMWVPRTGDMVHKHPGEDYNCRCTASPYLMELDEKTGKYAKGTDKSEDIEEVLHEEETEKVREDWIAELKQSPEYVDENGKALSNMVKTARALDEPSAPFVKEYLEAFQAKVNSNPELRALVERTGLKFVFGKDVPAEFTAGRIYIDITCWITNDRLKSDKVRLSTTLHELMHGAAAQHKKFAAYVENVFKAARDDFMKVPHFEQIVEIAEHGGRNLDYHLREHWKQFIRASLENENPYMETTAANITDFTHAIISGYMNEKQIETLNLKKLFKEAVEAIDSKTDPTGAWHDLGYYTEKYKNGKTVKTYREFTADEFQANMGSLYFTDRKVFNAYKKILPNAMQMVENFIKEGKIDIISENE